MQFEEESLFLDKARYKEIELDRKNILVMASTFCIMSSYLFSFNPNNLQIIDPKNGQQYVFHYLEDLEELKSWLRAEVIDHEETNFTYEPTNSILHISFHNIVFGKIDLTEDENDQVYEGVKNYYKKNGLVIPLHQLFAYGEIFRAYAHFMKDKLYLEMKEFILQ